MAPSFDETRWQEIVQLYEMLERRQPSLIHTLNRAIALAQWKGPEAALALLREASPPPWFVGYYLWDATQGELLRRMGKFDDAQKFLFRAVEGAPTKAERQIFLRRLQRCKADDASP